MHAGTELAQVAVDVGVEREVDLGRQRLTEQSGEIGKSNSVPVVSTLRRWNSSVSAKN
jgi:hypothetical protein